MPAQDTANLRPDIFEVFIADAAAPFHAVVSKSQDFEAVPITTQRYGSTPVAYLMQGHKCDLSFEFQEWTLTDLLRFQSIVATPAAVNDLPAIGTQLPTVSVRLHNAGDGADTTKDIVFPAVVFMSFSFNADGQGEARQVVPAMAIRDATSGQVVRVGYVAPEA